MYDAKAKLDAISEQYVAKNGAIDEFYIRKLTNEQYMKIMAILPSEPFEFKEKDGDGFKDPVLMQLIRKSFGRRRDGTITLWLKVVEVSPSPA